MKKLFVILVFIIPFAPLFGQIVSDPALIGALSVQHFNENQIYSDIKDNQSRIQNYQIAISGTLEKIRALEKKTQDYLIQINSVVQNAKDIMYATQIAQDIVEYQTKAFNIASGDPELVLIAMKAELQLVSKSLEVIQQIYQMALVDGEKNMLDNKQRLDMIRGIVDELRLMRGYAFTVYRQLRSAKTSGLLRTMFPQEFRYMVNMESTTNRILRDFKWITK
ncbi:plasmid transfer protein [Parabacteroides sp. PF5-9]|uniref:plasmid transfer protein n=1 Tax=Parabacteroides sp. PF5-9 TaxID=1742404 RepID=UPI0024766470|nr:plasmid transfer protein [Parabacteroides sp. PF5-9]MDH6358968.1 hypothetical protein [Parabacteroides sp. PF5-9]